MVGGFGVWFSGITLLTTSLLCYIVFLHRKKWTALTSPLIIISVVFLSVTINPASWWARYAPQLWHIPIIITICGLVLTQKTKLIYIILVAIGVNLLLMTRYFYYNFVTTQSIQQQLINIKNTHQRLYVNFQNHHSNRIRLEEAGIPYTETKSLQNLCTPDTLVGSTTIFCIAKNNN